VKPLAEKLASALGQAAENVVLFDRVDSTHAVALRLIEQIESESLDLRPTVVLASGQSRGVGRGGRQWVSPPGGLYLSWLASGLRDDTVARVPMLAAAAACGALAGVGVAGIGIKWPNDLLVGDRKLAGILIHCRRGATNRVVVSLGVNIVPIDGPIEDAGRPPVSLSELVGTAAAQEARAGVAAGFVLGLAAAIADPRSALEHWRGRLVHRVGDRIAVRIASGATETGRFAGLTDDGFLRLDQASGELVLTGGDIIEG
jgi:BirA family biotin operon repressor/biotin-[acetyl-CoA-carboxylase] ligase